MLTITVPGVESFDEEKQEFVTTEATVLVLEHSLVSLSKWESIFEKPFLGPDKKTSEETYAYIQAMCVEGELTDEVMSRLTEENVTTINSYIESKMTATWFKELPNRPGSREIITAEIIRYWMIALNVPLEYETRHLNQLFTLIKVINEKNKPAKKMSRSEMLSQRASLNAQRRQSLGTNG